LTVLTSDTAYSAEPQVNIEEAIEFRRTYTVGVYVLADVPRAISVLNDALVATNGNSNGVPALSLINKGPLQDNNSAQIQDVLRRRAEQFDDEERVKTEVRRQFNLGTASASSANTEFRALYSDFINLAADDLMGVDPNTLVGKVVFDAKEREQIINFLKKLKRAIIKLVQNMSVAGTLGNRPLLRKWSEILKDSLEVLNRVAQNNIASDDRDEKNVWTLLSALTGAPRSTVKSFVVHAKDGGVLLEQAIQIYQVIQDGGKLLDESDVYLRDLFYQPGFVFKNPDRAAAFELKPGASMVKDNWGPTWS
jgi:hypothetical protein